MERILEGLNYGAIWKYMIAGKVTRPKKTIKKQVVRFHWNKSFPFQRNRKMFPFPSPLTKMTCSIFSLLFLVSLLFFAFFMIKTFLFGRQAVVVWCDDDASSGDGGFHFLTKNTKNLVFFLCSTSSQLLLLSFVLVYRTVYWFIFSFYSQGIKCARMSSFTSYTHAEPLTPV